MAFRSIGGKIQWLTGTVFLVGLCAVLTFQTLHRLSATWAERMDANFRIVKGLSAPARGAIAQNDKSVINSYMELLSSDPRAAGIVLSSNHAVMVSQQSISHFDLPIETLSRFAIAAEERDEPTVTTMGDYEFVAVPVKSPALKNIGAIAVAWDTKGLLHEVWRSALEQALALFALAVAVLALVVLTLRRLVSVPITSIAAALRRAGKLDAGELRQTAALYKGRTDEIGTFAHALEAFYETAADKIRLSETLDGALSNMSQGLCMFDAQGRLVVSNRRFLAMYGLSESCLTPGLPGRDLLAAIMQAGRMIAPTPVAELAAGYAWMIDGKTSATTHEFANGATYTVCSERTPGGGWVTTHSDVTELKTAEKRLLHMARHDPLTNLPNRRRFHELLDGALQDGGRDTTAVLFLDLDRFKIVNDTLGHAAGDQLLKTVSARLLDCIRQDDAVCRLGGDEFAILQTGAVQPHGAEALALRIARSLAQPVALGKEQATIGVSIGIALAAKDGPTAELLLRHADLAVYEAKASGRNTHRFFTEEMAAKQTGRQALEHDLRAALAAEQFELRYQPIVDAVTGDLTGLEALLRWNHPLRGLLPPADFIGFAEETGLISPIGEWVLREACRQAARWPASVYISVNVSPKQFQRPDFAQEVFSACALSHLAPSRLHLEITEAVIMRQDEAAISQLNRIRGYGVKIVLDDFGTGYSALNYLPQFALHKIKIDRSFVASAEGSVNEAIIDAIVAIARTMGAKSVAEGVETEAQRERALAHGIDELQGFAVSAAVTGAEIESIYFSNRPSRLRLVPDKRKQATP